ncbi:MAG TPA: DUF4912 domain-containing protein [Chthoniobacterales bacterium]|nr:DUF4912 domain-containing protein [Chthoniobacterales bacterium]
MADFATEIDETSVENVAAAPESDEAGGGAAFVLSSRPIVPLEERAPAPSADFENLGDLPRSYGGAFLFAIARDPHTLFAYWDIDWVEVFGDNPPADRKAHLRVLWHEGIEESKTAVEPMAGSQLITVLHARSSYRIELGFYAPEDVWNSVATSDAVVTPPDDVAETGPIDVATVPFHLSFQRIVDAFRGSKYDGDAIVEIVGRLQEQADNSDASLPESERELLRTLESGLSGNASQQRARLRNPREAFFTRQRLESILGFGATSRM